MHTNSLLDYYQNSLNELYESIFDDEPLELIGTEIDLQENILEQFLSDDFEDLIYNMFDDALKNIVLKHSNVFFKKTVAILCYYMIRYYPSSCKRLNIPYAETIKKDLKIHDDRIDF